MPEQSIPSSPVLSSSCPTDAPELASEVIENDWSMKQFAKARVEDKTEGPGRVVPVKISRCVERHGFVQKHDTAHSVMIKHHLDSLSQFSQQKTEKCYVSS